MYLVFQKQYHLQQMVILIIPFATKVDNYPKKGKKIQAMLVT